MTNMIARIWVATGMLTLSSLSMTGCWDDAGSGSGDNDGLLALVLIAAARSGLEATEEAPRFDAELVERHDDFALARVRTHEGPVGLLELYGALPAKDGEPTDIEATYVHCDAGGGEERVCRGAHRRLTATAEHRRDAVYLTLPAGDLAAIQTSATDDS
jgi:hypothetical protein